jgi:hypothetical protein
VCQHPLNFERNGRNDKYTQRLIGKRKGKRPIETLTRRKEYIKMDRKEIGCKNVDWSPRAQDMA